MYITIILYCKGISQLNLQTMKMVMFSSFNFSWNISSDISARFSPLGWLEHLAETSEDMFQLKLKEENITIFNVNVVVYIQI